MPYPTTARGLRCCFRVQYGSRSGGSRRFYLNFYSLHSVTGNVGDTGNDLSLFGNGILQEILSQRVKESFIKSWMRWVVGVDFENLKPLNCKHNLHGFIWLFWFPLLSTVFICFCLIIKATFCSAMCRFCLQLSLF